MSKQEADKPLLSQLETKRGRSLMFWGIIASLLVLVGSFFAISVATFVLQYLKLERPHTPGDDEIVTLHTYAFLLSGPLTPLCMFFVGAVGAYAASTAVDMAKKRPSGVVFKLSEWFIFGLMWAVAMMCQIWLVAKLSLFKSYSQQVQSTPDSRPGSTTELDVQYLDGWFTSPLSVYVLGTNAYYIGALAAIGVLLGGLGVYVQYNDGIASKLKHRVVAASNTTIQWVANSFVALSVIGMLMLCVSHFLLCVIFVYNSPLIDEKHYWVIFTDAAVSYNFVFFFAGWVFFAWYLGVFAFKSYILKVATVVVGVVVLFISLTQLFAWGLNYDMLASCYDNIYTGEIYIDGEIGFCELQYAERRDHAGVWNWYFVNTILFMSFTALTTVATAMTLCCSRGDDRYIPVQGKKRDSGSETEAILRLNRVATRSSASAKVDLLQTESAPRGAYFGN